MMVADNDLLAMQEARILAERAAEARVRLAAFSQAKLDTLVEGMARAAEEHAPELAALSCEETGRGRREDKLFKIRHICAALRRELAHMRCVGPLDQDPERGIATIGVPLGVIASFGPEANAVSTALCHMLLAVKSGNALVISPHPRAASCVRRAADVMIAAGETLGLPEGAVARMDTANAAGARELMRHDAVALVLLSGSNGLRAAASMAGKAALCAGTDGGPAFVERSADVRRAAADIARSKTFDHGLAPSAETALVADAPIDAALRAALAAQGAWFPPGAEAAMLTALCRQADGRPNRSIMGLSAPALAQRAGFRAPEGTTLLLIERKYVCESDPVLPPAPILPYYVEPDWMHACQKCLELLLRAHGSHSMVIHSGDAGVIREFALKKPVARLLVNTPGSLGGMGVTTRLFPSLTPPATPGAPHCGAGGGAWAENLSPRHLIYVRTVACGTAETPVL